VSGRRLNLLGLVLVGIIGLAFMFLTPRIAELDTVLDLTVYMIMAILALSLALIWGYGGILCFGQSAFFGLGAYAYAIAMFNIGESTLPFLLAIILPAAFAALLGYFMFYSRISDVYLGVITLTVTLILFNSINSTAGPEFHIGAARRCSAMTRALISLPPSRSAVHLPVLPAACSRIGEILSARPSSGWRNRRRSSSGSLSAGVAR
jgi:branched-chain amino acid transport system permease protein